MDVDNSERPVCSRRRERLVHYYGTIRGEEVGKIYRNREKLKIIHHPDKSWIHLGPEGPYSIIVQGKKRFLDEGSLVIIFTKAPVGSAESDKNTANTILGNLKKAVKGRLPIRIVRVVKSERKTVFRYDGLYIMKKKLILHEKLHFLLTRIKNQPKVLFNLKRGACNKIRRLLALKKRTKRYIKKEPELKKEVTSNSDTERDSTTQTAELVSWDQFKTEFITLDGVGEEGNHDCDDGYEVWQRNGFPPFVKADSNEEFEGSTLIGYEEDVDKFETYYGDELDDTVDDLNNEEDQEHFSKEDVIIESIPLLKSENGESSNNIRTILAIVPESGTSEYVEGTPNVDFDPLCDPLGGFNDESKTSSCSDEMKDTSQEVKTCYDEKKSGQLYLTGCENIDGSEKDQFLPILPHPCLYNLTVGHLINLLGNGSHNHICPCNTQKCAAQRNFEVALRGLIDEGGKKICNPKCLKGIEDDDMKQQDSTEINYLSLNNVFNQLNAIICNKTTISDKRKPLIGKRQRKMTTRILRKNKTSTKNYHSKNVSREESLVSSSIEESLVAPSDEESSLPSSVEDSLIPLSIEESLVTSEDSPSAPAYGVTSPMPEDTAIRLHPLEEPLQVLNSDDHLNKRRKGRQKGSKNCSREAAQLGPVIPTEEPKPVPRRLRDKKISYRGATFFISSRSHSSRSSSRRRVQEEEDDFLGFVGPIRPSKKLRLLRCFLTRLLSLEQSSSLQ
nr:uncharacterized protein LOC106685917 isoform X2 [Halyomorpha halys]